MVSWETHGVVILIGFRDDEIGHMLFMRLHGLNVKEDVKGWAIVVVQGLLVHLVGWKARGDPSFSARASSTFPFLFLLTDFLRRESSLNETTMGLSVHVLVAGRAVQVTAPMSLNLLPSHF